MIATVIEIKCADEKKALYVATWLEEQLREADRTTGLMPCEVGDEEISVDPSEVKFEISTLWRGEP